MSDKTCIAQKLIGKPVMIRTNTAGVHYGILNQVETAADGYDVEIVKSRRIYSWTGAFTLSELSVKGSTKKDSKFAVNVPSQYLRAIEIIEMTPEGYDNLNSIKDYQIQD